MKIHNKQPVVNSTSAPPRCIFLCFLLSFLALVLFSYVAKNFIAPPSRSFLQGVQHWHTSAGRAAPSDKNTDYSLWRIAEETIAAQRLVAAIQQRHGIQIELYDAAKLWDSYQVLAAPLEAQDIYDQLLLLDSWLNLYPSVYLKRTGLQTIYLFKTIALDGVQTGGLQVDDHSIIITANESIFHHELFHVADAVDGGMSNDNADWMNQKSGSVSSEVRAGDSILALHSLQDTKNQLRPQGYVSLYAKLGGIDEDQATVAEEMLAHPIRFAQMVKEDAVLARARDILKRFFYVRSNGRMDAKFWLDLEQSDILGEQYWARREEKKDFVVNPEWERGRNLYPQLLVARNLLAEGKTQDAEKMYKSMIALNNNRTTLVRELGTYYREYGRYKDAIEIYVDKCKVFPQCQLELRIARNYESLHELQLAIEFYRKAYFQGYLLPSEVVHLQQLSMQQADMLLSQRNYKRALEEYRVMVRMFGNNAEINDRIKTASEALYR